MENGGGLRAVEGVCTSDFENRAGVLDRNLLDLKVMASSELAMNFGCRRVTKWLHAPEAMLTKGGV